jgi:hypothetical protein
MIIDNQKTEHFCTLFDSNFLPIGMTLHSSLMLHAQPFHLWIICMDEKIEEQLKIINLPSVTLIPLSEVETPELLEIKDSRSKGEYCWTITPFTFTAVFARQPDIERVTYLDADLFFFDNPRCLLQELDENNRSILITEHAYDPQYDQTLSSGRFCVQFLTAKNNHQGLNVIQWWQNKCLEWCFNRLENGKFGDQKYLDVWPILFAEDIWIVQQKERTLAPWNIQFFENILGESIKPVFYHFHSLRILKTNKLLLCVNYLIGKNGLELYNIYTQYLTANLKIVKSNNFSIPCINYLKDWSWKRIIKFRFQKKIYFQSLDYN